ncbi:hypothetical protein GCM10009119_21530 [Algoriphagus jejuensis]|uniref:Prokaryotic YEATS domain-containing protein n=2 Tax=Algoriphagus jejuensis TaxID=419934 RepID=A0ABN1N0X1_9BACT
MYIEPYLDKFKANPEEQNWIDKSEKFREEQKALEVKKALMESSKKRNERRRWIAVIVSILLISMAFVLYKSMESKQKEISSLQQKLDDQLKLDQTKELLTLVMRGRGPEYKNLTDEEIERIIYKERTYPLDSLIEIKASVSPSNKGGTNRNYTMWLDMPSFRKDEIKEVQYNFCRDFIDKLRISKDPTSSFSIGYLGYGYCPTMKIDIIRFQGDTITRYFSFEKYFEKNPLTD